MKIPVAIRIKNWFSQYKQALLFYRNGFWEIPYLSNTPEMVVRSIIKMPFTRHTLKRQFIQSTSPLIKGSFYYENIEEGLWLINSSLNYKANINYIRVGDKDFNSDWYLLNLTIFGVKQKLSLIDGIPYTNCSWMFFKPNEYTTNCHYKGAHEFNFTFYFNKNWLSKALESKKLPSTTSIRYFLDSEAKYDLREDNIDQCRSYCQPIVENFNGSDSRISEKAMELKKLSYELIGRFFSLYKRDTFSADHFKVSDKNRIAVYRSEKFMLGNLSRPFPGISVISREAGISETSLKAVFKLVYGKTLFQYFQEKQMLFAREILLKDQIKIKELARLMGYENSSKFALAFKKHIGCSPSEVKIQ